MTRVAFVSAPDPAATLRFDMSRPEVKVLGADNESIFGHPQFAGAPKSIGVDYGYRQMNLPVQVFGTEAFALTQLQNLAREMVRHDNWLLVQHSPTTAPVWFRTYRGEPGDLSYVNTGVNIWQINVPLVAEGFAYGARETQAMQAINNDLAAGSLACFAQLPAIKGDAPAAARIRMRYTNTQHGYRHMIATSPAPATYTAPITWQIGGTDGWTVGTDTGASAADAAMSGGTYRPVSFATLNGGLRLNGPAPTTVPPGRYKVLLRVARSDTTSTFNFRLGMAIGFSYVYSDTDFVSTTWGASAATKHCAWIDLGDFNIPSGRPLDLVGEIAVTPDIALQVGRLTGTGACWLDAFLLVPIGDEFARTMFVDYSDAGPVATTHDEYLDAEIERTYIRAPGSSDVLVSMPTPALSGGFHLLVPGANNVVHFVEQTSLDRAATGFGDAPDRIGTDAEMVVSYYPRYLNLRAD